MSQRLIIAIGLSGFIGIVLLIVLNVVSAIQSGPAASPVTAARPTVTASASPPTAAPTPTPTATATDTPTPVPTLAGPTPTPTPSEPAGPGQSTGTVILTITTPIDVEVTGDAVCEWAQDEPLRVTRVTTGEGVAMAVASESVAIQIQPDDVRRPLLIQRLTATGGQPHAPYGATRTHPGGLDVQPADAGRATGLVIFKGLGTTASSTPADLLPVKRALYGQPLGNQPNAALIDGSVAWQCQAPADFTPVPAQPSPTPAPSNDPSVARVPQFGVLASSGKRQTPVSGCIDSATSQDGSTTAADDCVSAWLSPDDYPTTIALRAAGRLVLTPEAGWKIARWTVRGSTVSDVEATLGKPKTDLDLFKGDRSSAPVGSIFFKAPSAGTWILRANITTVGPGKATAQTTYFIIIRTT